MDYLKVWTSFRVTISPLNEAEKGRLFDAMLIYAETGEEPSEFKGNERFLWPVAKQDIDRMSQKCETLKVNASKGGKAKSRNRQMQSEDSKDCQTVADDSKSYQDEANCTYKVNIKKRNIKENTLKGVKEKPQMRFTPPTVDEVRIYCQQRGNNVDPERFVAFYASKGWKVGNQPMKDWKACIITWEKRDNNTSPVKQVVAQQYQQRDYSQTRNPDDILDMLEVM